MRGKFDCVLIPSGTVQRVRVGLLIGGLQKTNVVISGYDAPEVLFDICRHPAGQPIQHLFSSLTRDFQAKTTHENAVFFSKVVRRNGYESALVVTEAFHMARMMIELERAGIGAKVTPYVLPNECSGTVTRKARLLEPLKRAAVAHGPQTISTRRLPETF